jgi:hypothetical protein
MHAAIWKYILSFSHTKKHTVSTGLIPGILALISFFYTAWGENLSQRFGLNIEKLYGSNFGVTDSPYAPHSCPNPI